VHEYASELTTTPKDEFFAVSHAGNLYIKICKL